MRLARRYEVDARKSLGSVVVVVVFLREMEEGEGGFFL